MGIRGQTNGVILVTAMSAFMCSVIASVPSAYAGRNLVLNGDFEQTLPLLPSPAVSGLMELGVSPHWRGLSGDIYSNSSVLNTGPLPIVPAAAGQYTYAGLIPLNRETPLTNGQNGQAGYREFIYGELDSPLIKGIHYHTEMKVAAQNNISQACGVRDFGFGVSEQMPIDQLPLTAQYGPKMPVNVALITAPGTYLMNTAWTTIASDAFIASGNERFVTVGLMNTDVPALANLVQPFYTTASRSYSYVDDVHLSCTSKPDFTVNGQFESEITLSCAKQIIISGAGTSANVLASHFTVEEVDETGNNIPGTFFQSSEQMNQANFSNTPTLLTVESLFPAMQFLAGHHYRLTRKSYCHDPAERESYSIVIHIAFADIPIQIASKPTTTSSYLAQEPIQLAVIPEPNQTVQSVLWSFDATSITTSIGAQTQHAWSEPGTYTIQASASLGKGCVAHGKTEITIQSDGVYLPNAFTPNADGLNDTFVPVTTDNELIELRIYNRQGSLIFVSTTPWSGWDGRNSNGDVSPNGTYAGMLRYRALLPDGTTSERIKNFAVNLIQ